MDLYNGELFKNQVSEWLGISDLKKSVMRVDIVYSVRGTFICLIYRSGSMVGSTTLKRVH